MWYKDIIVKDKFKGAVFQYLFDNSIPFRILGYMDIGVAISIQCVPSTADLICNIWHDAIVIPEVSL